MARFVYSSEQLQFIKNGSTWMAIGKLTAAFNSRFGLDKTEGQIRSMMKNNRISGGRFKKSGMRARRLLTAEQMAFVAEGYRAHSVVELTADLNRRFGLTVMVSQLKCYLKNHGITSGRCGRFKKGGLPWNAGTAGSGICKPNSGTFEKGNVPGNTRTVGAERRCSKDGYVLVKIVEKNPYTGAKTRFKAKHVVEFEKRNGPVPKGMVVRLVDGDVTNCCPENLLLITRAEHLRLTKLGFKGYPESLKPAVVAIARLEAKTFSRKREFQKNEEKICRK